MSDKVTIHCYVDQLISNDDGKYDTFGSAWFTVPTEWLLKHVLKSGFSSLEDFYSNYTYDDTDGLMDLAIDEGKLIGCGTGSME